MSIHRSGQAISTDGMGRFSATGVRVDEITHATQATRLGPHAQRPSPFSRDSHFLERPTPTNRRSLSGAGRLVQPQVRVEGDHEDAASLRQLRATVQRQDLARLMQESRASKADPRDFSTFVDLESARVRRGPGEHETAHHERDGGAEARSAHVLFANEAWPSRDHGASAHDDGRGRLIQEQLHGRELGRAPRQDDEASSISSVRSRTTHRSHRSSASRGSLSSESSAAVLADMRITQQAQQQLAAQMSERLVEQMAAQAAAQREQYAMTLSSMQQLEAKLSALSVRPATHVEPPEVTSPLVVSPAPPAAVTAPSELASPPHDTGDHPTHSGARATRPAAVVALEAAALVILEQLAANTTSNGRARAFRHAVADAGEVQTLTKLSAAVVAMASHRVSSASTHVMAGVAPARLTQLYITTGLESVLAAISTAIQQLMGAMQLPSLTSASGREYLHPTPTSTVLASVLPWLAQQFKDQWPMMVSDYVQPPLEAAKVARTLLRADPATLYPSLEAFEGLLSQTVGAAIIVASQKSLATPRADGETISAFVTRTRKDMGNIAAARNLPAETGAQCATMFLVRLRDEPLRTTILADIRRMVREGNEALITHALIESMVLTAYEDRISAAGAVANVNAVSGAAAHVNAVGSGTTAGTTHVGHGPHGAYDDEDSQAEGARDAVGEVLSRLPHAVLAAVQLGLCHLADVDLTPGAREALAACFAAATVAAMRHTATATVGAINGPGVARGPGDKLCFNCYTFGHVGNECPSPCKYCVPKGTSAAATHVRSLCPKAKLKTGKGSAGANVFVVAIQRADAELN